MTIEQYPEVWGPENRPRPHQFDTSDSIYGDGFPNVPLFEWEVREAARVRADVVQDTTVSADETSGRLRTQRSIINLELLWYGQIVDSDFRDSQNSITPLFKP